MFSWHLTTPQPQTIALVKKLKNKSSFFLFSEFLLCSSMFLNLVTSDKMDVFTCMRIAYTKHIQVHVNATINITTDQPTYIVGVDRLSAPILSILPIIDIGHFKNRFADNFFCFVFFMQTNILFKGDIIYWWINNTGETM